MDGAHSRGKKPDPRSSVTIREATLIPGDGIGPEITAATLQVLAALGVEFEWDEEYGGMAAGESEPRRGGR